jgi:hypothetical protein
VTPTGTLNLEGGRIELRGLKHDLVVSRLGRLAAAGGSLSIETPGRLINNGVVEGPFILEADYVQGPTGTRRATIFSPTPAPSAPESFARRLARTVTPIAAARIPSQPVRAEELAYAPMVVLGNSSLGGRLELQFGNGFAPRAGDRFPVISVGGAVTGSFDDVEIQGLVPGTFAFEPSVADGTLGLTSTMDAVALPAVHVKAKARLKETGKKLGKIKLKRTGDTRAPLVVSYRLGGTAVAGVDYEPLPGTITIPARERSATIVVKPIRDGLRERTETIELELLPDDTFAPGAVSRATIALISKERAEESRPK